jgi:hypothetical protein
MKRDLFDMDTPREALIDTGRRAGDREPLRQPRDANPAGVAAGGGCEPNAAPQAGEFTQAGPATTSTRKDGPEDAAPLARARVCVTCAKSAPFVAPGGQRTGTLNCAEQQPWFVMEPMAGCHFKPSRWVALEAGKLAKVVKQAAIEQAVGAADRAAPGWSEQAFGWIGHYAQRRAGVRLTGFDLVRLSIEERVQQPENPKAWGGPIQRAARAGYLVKVGTVADPNPERHGSDVPLWECACVDTP